jgi:alpha-tubulin suppressor-like RCC1 family protein
MPRSLLYLGFAAATSASACRDTTLLEPTAYRPTPHVVRIVPLNRINSISAGAGHTCVTRGTGEVDCWGVNEFGQVGVGIDTLRCGQAEFPPVFGKPLPGFGCVTVPTPIPGRSFRQVSAGWNHSCGIATDGTSWCWGLDDDGQLGTQFPGGREYSPVPAAQGFSFESISAGRSLSCGVVSSALICWGRMVPGTSAILVPATQIFAAGGTTPPAFTGVSMGNDQHVCGRALPVNGTHLQVACFGPDMSGQPSIDPAHTAFTNPFLFVTGPDPLTTPQSGNGFTCYDVTGGVACFGRGDLGQLGNGMLSPSLTPVTVTNPASGALHGVVAGDHHACALDPAGNAWCWGNNDGGQVGTSTMGAIASPVAVPGGHTFISLAAGGTHTCGITKPVIVFQNFVLGPSVWCWGEDLLGQLGDNRQLLSTGTHFTATPVLTISQ